MKPKEKGFRMPAEWAPHAAVWLSWPHDTDTFPDLPAVEKTYAEVIAALHRTEEVRLFVADEAMRERAEGALAGAGTELGRVRFFVREYADVWIRDYGPIYVTDPSRKALAMTHWRFNAWGGKYENVLPDTRIPGYIHERLHREERFAYYKPGLVLEGGSIDVNGKGTLLTTEQCLLAPTRNPHLDRKAIERRLDEYLGASHVVWLGGGIEGDDTDGHVDDVARFVSEDTVVCAVEEDPLDPNHEVLEDCRRRLEKARDQDGRPLRIVPLPMPGRVERPDGRRLPASYANFYIGNGKVLVPVFGHENDGRALDVLRKVFPGRDVAGVDCRALIRGLGALHCISQQEPAL